MAWHIIDPDNTQESIEKDLRTQEILSEITSDKQKTLQRKWPLIILLCICLFAASLSIFNIVKKPAQVLGNQDISRYDAILSASEKQEWETKEAKPREVFIQLNTKMTVTDGTKADLRLINPPYSRYLYQVELFIEGEGTLFQSSIEPGEIFETVELNKTLTPGDYNAVILYNFFDGNNKPSGSRQVDVTLLVEKIPELNTTDPQTAATDPQAPGFLP